MIKEAEQPNLPSGKEYWKSLDSLAETPGFKDWVSREFPEGASMLEGVQRRSFVKLMAASFGLAGLGMTGCRRPEHVILPYGKSPEELIPGVPAFYATAHPTGRGFQPLIVESHQGRPTKVEGNPSYLPYGGSTDVYSQASVLDLYDPDRSQGSFARETLKNGVNRWKKVSTKSVLDVLNDEVSDGKVAVLTNRSHSLLRQSLQKKVLSSGIQWFEHDAIDYNSAENKLGKALGLQKALRAVPDLSSAKRVLSLDSDFLGNRESNELANTRAFMSGRKVLKPADAKRMNRLYIAESDLSRTGGVADHRLRVESSQMIGFASLVASELLSKLGRSDQSLKKHLKNLSSFTQNQKKWATEAVADLLSNPKKSVILAGGHLPAEVQLLAYEMNRLLGAIGSTINYIEVGASADSILSLESKINEGSVERLFILGGNPVYQTKGFINWEDLSKKLKFVARLGGSIDESSQIANYHLGQSHYLESWDLGTTWDQSSFVPVQPLIAPLFDTISEASLLSHLVGEQKDDHSLVENLHSQYSNGGDFNDFLRLGVLATKPVTFTSLDATKAILSIKPGKVKSSKLTEDNLEVVIIPDFHAHDGQYANNGWMQECPDPINKLTWDNALLVSPVLAKILESKHAGLGLLPKPTMLNKSGQIAPDAAQFDGGKQKAPVVTVRIGDRSITAPLYVQPGLADFTLVATLGHGRSNVGRVGQGTGYDVTPLLSDESLVLTGVSIEPTGDFEVLANVQEHWSMEGRAIVREANVDEYAADPGFASHMGAESHSPPMWGKDQGKSLEEKATTTPRGNSAYEHPDHTYEKSDVFGIHQWGMTIDLNQCTGCSACVVACQSENNIPVVGKDQVLRGREMHWIRLDRYFSSTARDGAEIPSDVQVSFQGVACMHCETAPCETVCPVNATVHDEEGLNAMAYNRCVGTRYCANNCPYKVRRFNFFDWNKRKTDELYQGPMGDKNDSLVDMGKNPDVTVRMRGVMEKCTYCVQRIQESKIRTKVNAQQNAKYKTGEDGTKLKLEVKDLKVPDGTIKTACQQVCPSDAIVFGDISDPSSEVSKLKNNPRDYSVLGYLNTRPRTTFLAKVRNPNPKMPDFASSPHSAREYHDAAHPSHHGDEHGAH
jgi:MoCo/4Fe-4S cofactor protein with predicted Tat translocation signal